MMLPSFPFCLRLTSVAGQRTMDVASPADSPMLLPPPPPLLPSSSTVFLFFCLLYRLGRRL